MWFSSWLRNKTVSRKQRPANRFRPQVELLEDRAVPATLTVNTTLDILGHTNGMLSLRQAVIDANARTAADTIVVPAGIYTLTRTGQENFPDGGLIGDLDINTSTKNPLTINGAGADTTVIDGGGLSRVFYIYTADTVSISGLTIKGGNAGKASGGGIANWHAPLTVSDCVFSGNSGGGAGGGAIMNFAATLTVNHCTFSGNFTNSTLQTFGNGGAILNLSGTMTVSNSTFSGNSAQAYGGAIYNLGTLTVSNSTFSGNTAQNGGGIANMASMTVSNCTLSGNSARHDGGGIFNIGKLMTIHSSTVKGNTAPFGADLYGTALLSDTTIGGVYYP